MLTNKQTLVLLFFLFPYTFMVDSVFNVLTKNLNITKPASFLLDY